MKRRILIVHERAEDVARLVRHLPAQRFSIQCARTPDEARRQLMPEHPVFDLALVAPGASRPTQYGPADRRLGGPDRRRNDAIDLMSAARAHSPQTDVLLLASSRPGGPQALVHGDTVSPQPFTPEELASLIRARARRRSRAEAEASRSFRRLLGVAADVTSSLDLDHLLRYTCRGARDLLRVSHVAVALLSTDLASGVISAEYPEFGTKDVRFPVLEVPAARRVVDSGDAVEISGPGLRDQLGPLAAAVQSERVTAMLVAPVKARGRVLGCLVLSEVGRHRRFNPEERKLCDGLASLLGVSIENARLYRESARRAEDLERLRWTTLKLVEHVDREELLRRIIRAAVELVHATGGGIYEFDPVVGRLTIVADHARPSHLGKSVRVGEGMAGELVRSRLPYLTVPDYREYGNKAAGVFSDGAFGSVLEVLLTWEDQIVGVLYVDDEIGREFDPEHIRVLRLYAEQAAAALGSTAWPRPAALEFEAASALLDDLGVTPLDQRLAVIAAYAARFLNAENAGVFLVREPGMLSLEASYGHREGTFQKGRRLAIQPNAGLTGHIAFLARPFRAHGEALLQHPAVRNPAPGHLPAGRCHSIVALPLFAGRGAERALKALLRVENKRGPDGRPSSDDGFSEADERTLQAFGDAVALSIANDELVAELHAQQRLAERRRELMDTLHAEIRRVRSEQGIKELRQEVTRAAVNLVGAAAGCLYMNHPRVGKLEVVAVTGLDPKYGIGTIEELAADTIQGLVARDGRSIVAATPHEPAKRFGGRQFETIIAVPMGSRPSSVDGVIVVAGNSSHHPFAELECEVLEQFAAHEAAAFQTCSVRSWPTAAFEQAESLRRLMAFMTSATTEEQVLAALVTGATARYGLGLNRAAVFLLREDDGVLAGALGVGDVDHAKAVQQWNEGDDLDDVDRYLSHLQSSGHYKTELDERVRDLRMPSEILKQSDALRTVYTEGFLLIATRTQLLGLPDDVMRALDGDLARVPRPMVVSALNSPSGLLGFLIADSLFKQDAISHETMETVVTLSRTAAAALSRLRGDGPVACPTGVELHRIVMREFLRTALEGSSATSAVLWSHDAARGWRLAEWVGVRTEHELEFRKRSPQAGHTTDTVIARKWLPVADVDDEARAPFLSGGTGALLRQIGVRSFQGIAVTLGQEVLGVLYLNYDQTRDFDLRDRDSAMGLARDAALMMKAAQFDVLWTHAVEQLQATQTIASMGVQLSTWMHDVQKIVREIKERLVAQQAEPATGPSCAWIAERLDSLLLRRQINTLFENLADIEINGMLEEIYAEALAGWRSKGFDLILKRWQEPLIVRANRAFLSEAFGHFRGNAFTALMNRRNTRSPALEIAVRKDAAYAEIDFKDTGDGMSAVAMADSAAAPLNDPATGFGIGLKTAHTILGAYGGSAKVLGVPGGGTNVRVRLPLVVQGTTVV